MHPTRRIALAGLAVAATVPLLTEEVSAAPADYIPKAGEFPPVGAGVYLAGELVDVDHVNRRGAIRLIGDTDDGRYHSAPSHRFAMLPFGWLRYHGAPAELRDIPLGTVLHGIFLLPPAGDTAIPPSNDRYVPKHSHALTLEDDFSFYQRQGRSWKVASVALTYDAVPKDGDWRKRLLTVGTLTATPTPGTDGLTGEQKLTIDRSTRIWRGRELVEWEDIAADAMWAVASNTRTLAPGPEGVHVNLTWAPDWKNGQFHVADLWLDETARRLASERQRQVHIRHVRHRWPAGWVDHVEHLAGGRGIVTVTLFGNLDPSIADAVRGLNRPGAGAALAAAEWTLRSWWQEHDNKHGQVVEVKEIADPPPGSSGLRLKVRLNELLEGFRPGRIVRVRPDGFPNVKLPPEERVKGLDDR